MVVVHGQPLLLIFDLALTLETVGRMNFVAKRVRVVAEQFLHIFEGVD